MQKKIVSFFGPGQSSSSKRPRAEDEDDISSSSNSETDENATYTSDDLEEFIIEDDSVCDNECCDSERDKPYLPTSTEILKKSKGNRHFQ